jgi:DNA-binding MarR family transcriptional regulator
MSDKNYLAQSPAASALFLREAEVQRGIELLYFGHAHFWRSLDMALAEAGLGRADYRALYFIARRPGITVGELMALLGISKQALGRVLAPLEARALITTRPGGRDRRQKELRLTANGAAAEARLFALLRDAMGRAYSAAGQDAVTGFWRVSEALIPARERGRVLGEN